MHPETDRPVAQQTGPSPHPSVTGGFVHVPGLDVHGMHVAGSGHGAGGDWYEAFALDDDRVVLSIGEIGGGGPQAGKLAHSFRETLHACARNFNPVRFVTAAEALMRAQNVSEYATAIVGVIDVVAQTFTYVSAGHPPPFVRYADRTVAALPADGLPIGLSDPDHPRAQAVVNLHDAALLVLYTPGALRTTRDIDAGLRRLHSVLADERIMHSATPAAWLSQRMVAQNAVDDAAYLVLNFTTSAQAATGAARYAGPRWSVSWSFDATAASTTGARRAYLAYLEARAADGVCIDITAAELIFGELVGNVVRHAPGPVEIVLDWTADLPVLTVIDSGPGFRSRGIRERLPVNDLSESGRGLFIINACAVRFCVRSRKGRGTYASATLPML